MGKHGQHGALVGLLLLAASPAVAGCRLALVLALDISASVDEREDALQRGGLARALLAPEVTDAFLADPDAPVWLTVYEWSGPYAQAALLPWTEIAAEADLHAAAAAIAGSTRSRDDMPTALGHALGYAAALLRDGPDCDARTVDVSGDGRNNEGFPPAAIYRAHRFGEVTVNALAIAGGEAGLVEYYAAELIHGPGAFVMVADGFRDYERAIRAKLLRELAVPVIGALPQRGGRG